jgi:hypothetical protein
MLFCRLAAKMPHLNLPKESYSRFGVGIREGDRSPDLDWTASEAQNLRTAAVANYGSIIKLVTVAHLPSL